MTRSHTVVIGAGPGGLSAAYELGKLGLGATVLEAEDQVGGLSRTINLHGYRFDAGGHRFFSKVPLINRIWSEILGNDFLLRQRLSRIHYRNHYFDYPLKPLNALRGLGPVEALAVGLSYGRARLFPHQPESNFEQWVVNRFGSRLYEIFFKTYTEKVWGIPCNEISANWAAQRIKNLSLSEALRSTLLNSGRTKSGEIITTLIDEFHYPRHGPGMMWERCAELVGRHGTHIMLGTRVERIRHRGGRIESVLARRASGERVECAGDHVVSSMPMRELIAVLDPPAPDHVRRAAAALRYRDHLTVALIAKRESIFPDNWIYIHSPDVKVGRIQNYKNWSPEMVPDPSRTSLGLEYFFWDTDEEWTWSSDRLIENGISDCVRIGLLEPSEVDEGRVLRMEKAYPVYDQDYLRHVATIRAYVTGFANLQLIGRNGQHRYNNQDHSMLTGILAARNIAGASHDVWSVNVEQVYLEDGRSTVADRRTPVRAGDAIWPASP